jgi:hypothetical protein
MATKHLYECEDVAATLLYGFLEGDSVLAVRAAKELYVSGETELLHRLLTLAWLLDDPENPQESLRMKAFCAQDHSSLLFLLCNSTKHALPLIPEESDARPPSGIQGIVDGWTKIPNGWTVEQAAHAKKAIHYALKHKYWQHAVYLSSPLICGNTHSLVSLLHSLGIPTELTSLLETTVYTPLAHRILMHAFASLVASPAPAFQPEKRLQAIWNSADPVGRTGRVLNISTGALSVWRLRRKSVSRLVGTPTMIAEEDATAYWRNAVVEHNVSLKDGEFCFADDDQQESFYEKCFPDDIPDEWSVEERKKSHDVESVINQENPWQTAFLLCWA